MSEKELNGLVALVALGLLVPVMLLNAWALTLLWAWFVVPTFDVPALTIPVALGLSLIIALFKPITGEKQSVRRNLAIMIVGIIFPPCVVGIGYIVQLFV